MKPKFSSVLVLMYFLAITLSLVSLAHARKSYVNLLTTSHDVSQATPYNLTGEIGEYDTDFVWILNVDGGDTVLVSVAPDTYPLSYSSAVFDPDLNLVNETISEGESHAYAFKATDTGTYLLKIWTLGYYAFNYTVESSHDVSPEPPPDTTPPAISMLSPENKTYASRDIKLDFAIDEHTYWIGRSLDGQTNVTITGNTTLISLLDESHHVVVYANDTAGNMGASNTVYFTVDTTPPNIMDVYQAPEKNNVLPADEVKVNATITDNLSVVKRVDLNYTNGNGTWIIANMTNFEGNKWNGTIPAFDYCTYVNYTIVAEDNVGNIITTEEIFGYQYQYHVIPEFPSFLILLILMTATLLVTLLFRKHRTPNT